MSKVQILPKRKPGAGAEAQARKVARSKKGIAGVLVLGGIFALFTALSVVNVVQHRDRVETYAVAWVLLIPPAGAAWFVANRKDKQPLRRTGFLMLGLLVGLFAFIFTWAVAVTRPVGLVAVAGLVVGLYVLMAKNETRTSILGGGALFLAFMTSVAFSPYVLVAGPLAAGAVVLTDAATGFQGVALVQAKLAGQRPKARRG